MAAITQMKQNYFPHELQTPALSQTAWDWFSS